MVVVPMENGRIETESGIEMRRQNGEIADGETAANVDGTEKVWKEGEKAQWRRNRTGIG